MCDIRITRLPRVSLDDYAGMLRRSCGTSVYQLAPGAFEGQSDMVDLGGCRLLRKRVSNAVLLHCDPAQELCLCFPLDDRVVYLDGRPAGAQEQLVLLPAGQRERPLFIYLPSGAERFVVSMNLELLATVLGPSRHDAFVRRLGSLAGTRARFPEQGAWLGRMLALMEARFVDTASGDREQARAEAVRSIHDFIMGEHDLCDTVQSSLERIFGRAIRAVVQAKGAISVAELAKRVHSSRRNLNYAFRATCDMTPKQFIKQVRLNEFRRALGAASGSDELRLLYADFGFTNPGRAAREYSALFGEAPRATVR